MIGVHIDYEKCIGSDCGECTEACMIENLKFVDGVLTVMDMDSCQLCEYCADVCPEKALTVEYPKPGEYYKRG